MKPVVAVKSLAQREANGFIDEFGVVGIEALFVRQVFNVCASGTIGLWSAEFDASSFRQLAVYQHSTYLASKYGRMKGFGIGEVKKLVEMGVTGKGVELGKGLQIESNLTGRPAFKLAGLYGKEFFGLGEDYLKALLMNDNGGMLDSEVKRVLLGARSAQQKVLVMAMSMVHFSYMGNLVFENRYEKKYSECPHMFGDFGMLRRACDVGKTGDGQNTVLSDVDPLRAWVWCEEGLRGEVKS